jgi:hypothetical protein
MEMRTDFRRNVAMGFAVLMALSSILVNPVTATNLDLNLPSTIVRMEVSNGTVSYFETTLSEVPLGYDVTNGTYVGWCVDQTAEMERSPATHAVKLYSSINPPGELAGEKWDMVNYILNHKQGDAKDIQQAIWYFIHINGNYTPTSTVAWTIVNDTLANGNGFFPEIGQMIAVICYPMVLLPEPTDVQISIIEVTNTVISEFPSFLVLPLFMIATLLAVMVHRRKKATSSA